MPEPLPMGKEETDKMMETSMAKMKGMHGKMHPEGHTRSEVKAIAG